MRATSRALAFASRWFDEATVDRVFAPLIADWQREWQDASGIRRWSVHLRALTAFCCAALLASPGILRQPTPSAVSNRIVTRIARFTLIATVVQTLPFGSDYGILEPSLLFLIPCSLVLMFPFAMIPAVDAIRRDYTLPAYVERATLMKLGGAALVFMIVFGGFVVPASNQAFRAAQFERSLRGQGMDETHVSRVMSGGDTPRRGLRELSTYELLTDHGFADGSRFLQASVNQELNNRASIAVLPVLLLWMRWRLLDMPHSRWSRLPPTVSAIGAFVGFTLLRTGAVAVERGVDLPSGGSAWAPVFFIAAAMWFESSWQARSMVRR